MAEGAAMGGGGNSEYVLNATLSMRDQMTGKLRSTVSQLRSVDGAVSKLGNNSAIAQLSRQLDNLNNLRSQVNQFRELKKSVAATQQAYNQANSATAGFARQYRQSQAAISQLKAKHDELAKTFSQSQSATSQLKTKLAELKAESAKAKSNGAVDEYKRLQNQVKSTAAELRASQSMTRQTGAELKSLASGVKQAQRELGNIGSSFDQSKKKAAQLKQELKTQQPTLNQMRQSLLSQGFDTRDFAASDRRLRERIAAASADLRTQRLRETLSSAGMKLSNGNVNVNVGGNATSKLGAIRKELQSITQKTWNVAVNAKNAIGGRINDFASGAMLGMGAQFMGTAGIGFGMIDAVKTYKDFEYEMKTVSAITGAYRDETGQRLADLTNLAKHYGETTMFKASEVASAEKYAAMAGWSDEYIKAGLKPMLDLATASGEDLRRTSDIVTDAMTAFHLKPEEMYKLSNGQMVNVTEHFADVMAALATSSNTDVNMAGESAKYSAAIIGAMYGSQGIQDRMHGMEDWAVFQGLMADTGIKASMAGTATRSIFTRLASMQMNADAARDILGVDLVYQQDDAEGHKAGQVRRSLDIIGDLRKKFQGGFESAEDLMNTIEYFDESGKRFTKQQRRKIGAMLESAQKNGGKMTDKDMLALSNMLAGQEALSGMLALITSDDETWNKKIAAIQNAHGRASEMSEVKMDTLEGDLKTLGSAFEAFQLEIMTGNGAEGLRSFMQGLTEDIRAFKKSLEDGFDIGDIGGVVAKVVTQLKNKFLEFDGVGSILAGGALMLGLKKIYNLTMQVKNAAMSMKSWYGGTPTTSPTMTGKNGTLAPSVGSMVVHANSVVVNGKTVTQSAGTATAGRNGTTVTTSGASASNTTTTATTQTRTSRLGNIAKVGGGAGLFAAAFAAMDIYATRSTNSDRMSAAQSEYKEAQEQYQIIAEDSERSAELPSASEKLQQATANLKAVQKEAVQHNNESLFGGAGAVAGMATGAAIGSVIPGAGTAVGAIAGLVIGGVLSMVGAEAGKELGKNFDFDVLGWLKGENGKTPAGESPTPKADWKTDSGKMYSELSATERIQYHQNESETEKSARISSESEVAKIENQQYEAELAKQQAAASRRHRQDATKEEIDSQTTKYKQEEQQQRNALIPFSGNVQTPVVASMYGDKTSQEVAKITNGEYGKIIDNEIAYFKSLFNRDKSNEPNHLGIQQTENTGAKDHLGMDVKKSDSMGTDFWSSVGDFFKGVVEGVKNDNEVRADWIKPKTESLNVADVGNSGMNPVTGQPIITPTMPNFELPEFNFSDMLPDFSLSQWWSEQTSELANIDLTSMLPDFSPITTSISETFAQIPTVASEAFNTISTYANDGLAAIQTAWNELPSFFDGLFAGLGGVATSAGSAIASGINSGIGMIQSAWESLSGWLSAKISSLSSMASNAVSAITSFGGGGGGVGHNAIGTASWRGGFTEVNELGGEIIDLPSGARIYPHATTMKMLQSDLQDGKLDFMMPSSNFGYNELGNPQSFQIPELSTFPQAFDMGTLTQGISNNTTSNSTTNNSGLTVSGNTFTINKGSDIDEIFYKIFQMLSDAQANNAGVMV